MLVNESSEKTALADLGSDLAKDLAKLEGQQDVFNSDLRHEVVRKARQVLLEVSSPLQFMMMQVSNFHIYVAVRTLAMHGVFKNIPATKAISIDDLANKTAMPAPLLRRQVRLLAVAQILIEESLDHFAHTRLSRQYSEAEDLHSMLEVVNERVTRSMSTLPDYVAARKLAPEEEDHQHCPFTWSRGKDGTSVWDIMAETGELSRFQTGLNPSNKNFPTVGFYDFASLAQGDLGGRDVLVDVGGGIGQVLTAIINSAPEMLSVASKCVLQDLEGPVGQAQSLGHLPSGVRTMPHSFFNEQPIKGEVSRGYLILVRRAITDILNRGQGLLLEACPSRLLRLCLYQHLEAPGGRCCSR